MRRGVLKMILMEPRLCRCSVQYRAVIERAGRGADGGRSGTRSVCRVQGVEHVTGARRSHTRVYADVTHVVTREYSCNTVKSARDRPGTRPRSLSQKNRKVDRTDLCLWTSKLPPHARRHVGSNEPMKGRCNGKARKPQIRRYPSLTCGRTRSTARKFR